MLYVPGVNQLMIQSPLLPFRSSERRTEHEAALCPYHGGHALAAFINSPLHAQNVRKRLVAGGSLLLLYGLNEVREAYDEVAHQIRHLINENPNNRFVVTCRSGIYRDELRREFVTFQLERLSGFNAGLDYVLRF